MNPVAAGALTGGLFKAGAGVRGAALASAIGAGLAAAAHFQPGLRLETIKRIEEIYKGKMDQLKLGFPVPVECSEDETNILSELRWNHRRDALPGT